MPTEKLVEQIAGSGLAGMAAALLCLQWWLVRRLLKILEDTTAVINQNTSAINSLERSTAELVRNLSDLRDRLLSRPCIAE